VKSTWKPDQPLNKILSGLSKFEYARKRQFIPQHKKLDLTKFQVGILKKICNTKKIIIAHTVKNIGPVGVDIKQYIRWGLQEQLLDLKTYQLLSEEKAKIAANQPCSTIYQWGRKHSLCDSLTKDNKRSTSVKNPRCNLIHPFGYFYLTIKIHKTHLFETCLFQSCKPCPFTRIMGRPCFATCGN